MSEDTQVQEDTQEKCLYCGCTEKDSLLVFQMTANAQFIVCNGKTGKAKSHAHAFCKHIKQPQIYPLLRPNMIFQCSEIDCQDHNPFNLYYTRDGTFICKLHAKRNPRILTESVPLISNGEFCTQIVKIPTAKYEIDEENLREKIRELMSFEPAPPISPIQETNPAEQIDSREYCEIMMNFVEHESSTDRKNCYVQIFDATLRKIDNELFITNCPSLIRKCSVCTRVTVQKVGTTNIECWNIVKYQRTRRFKVSTNTAMTPGNIQVKVTCSEKTYQRRLAAISELENLILNNQNLEYLPIFYGDTDSFNRCIHETPINIVSELLNQKQKEALRFAVSRKFSCIEGPPGTGKSTTIVELIKNYFNNGIRPILVEAVTNIAANHITQLLKNQNLNVIRLISETYMFDEDSLSSDIRPLCVTTLKKKDLNGIRRTRQNTDIIVTTTSKSASIDYRKWRFKALIYDEGSVCLDVDLLISCVKKIPRVTIFGDTKQLPPFITSKKAANLGFQKSFMEKMSNFGIPSIQLDTQYRMHPELSKIVSNLFYEDTLHTAFDLESDSEIMEQFVKYPNPRIPLLVWDRGTSMESYSSTGSSLRNDTEVKSIVELIKEARSHNIEAEDIGIITFYAEQQEAIQNDFEIWADDDDDLIEYFQGVDVATVDGFQGREKKHIILSTVRTYQNHIGFLSDKRRACVALSRMKSSLLVVANVNAFDTSIWKQFFDICRENNVIHNNADLTPLRLT